MLFRCWWYSEEDPTFDLSSTLILSTEQCKEIHLDFRMSYFNVSSRTFICSINFQDFGLPDTCTTNDNDNMSAKHLHVIMLLDELTEWLLRCLDADSLSD